MIENRSDLAHAWFRKLGPRGEEFDVMAIRASFRIERAPVRLVPEPATCIVPGDEFDGPAAANPLGAVIRREGDTVLFKPSTDIHVVGTARSADNAPTSHWLAGINVGGVQKVVQVCGPRRFELGLVSWRLTQPEPVSAVALDYRLAFGGHFLAPEPDPQSLYKPDNPAGIGWLPRAAQWRALKAPARRHIESDVLGRNRFPAPQIEDPRRPVEHPEQDLPAEGLGPIARWCEPRLSRQGTRDARWRASRYPGYPDDFDPRFFQSAPEALISPTYLQGNEPVVLAGLFPEGRLDFELPGCKPAVIVVRDDASQQISIPALDTVAVDLDRQQLSLTWRTSFSRRNPVRQATLVREAQA
jgi:hypothetical protein